MSFADRMTDEWAANWAALVFWSDAYDAAQPPSHWLDLAAKSERLATEEEAAADDTEALERVAGILNRSRERWPHGQTFRSESERPAVVTAATLREFKLDRAATHRLSAARFRARAARVADSGVAL